MAERTKAVGLDGGRKKKIKYKVNAGKLQKGCVQPETVLHLSDIVLASPLLWKSLTIRFRMQ